MNDFIELKKKIEDRIAELKKADAEFCNDRWDPTKSRAQRFTAREMSNEVTARRHELEDVIKTIDQMNTPAPVLVTGLMFEAESLDGKTIKMSFSQISTKYAEDDVFYYNNGIGEPIACQLSSLAVVIP